MMKNTRLAIISVLALVAAPLLAGCATNGNNNGGATINLTFKLGTMMPLTGALNSLGPSMQNGAKLAIKMINEANVGLKIEATHEDDTTTDKTAATNTFNRLVSTNGVTAVVGPCCSGVTASVLDLAKQNEVVAASPSATAPSLTDNPNPYFWRVAPSDAQQGKVIAKVMGADGIKRVNIIAVNNAYGNGLEREFKAAYSGTALLTAKYDENSPGDMSSQVTQVCAAAGTAAGPEAIVLFAYVADGSAALKAMQNQGCLSKVKVYGSEGIWDAALISGAGKDANGKWLAAGVKGTAPGVPEGFKSVYKTEYGEDAHLYAAESFDAVMYLALSAIAGKSVDGKDIQANLIKVANSPGTKYRGDQFKAAAEALLKGDDIDYQGYAHDFNYDETKREPTSGVYDVWTVTADGALSTVQTGVTP